MGLVVFIWFILDFCVITPLIAGLVGRWQAKKVLDTQLTLMLNFASPETRDELRDLINKTLKGK